MVAYTDLLLQIQQEAENYETTFVSNIPAFVRRAEVRIFHEARLQAYQTSGTMTLTAGSQFAAWPAGFVVCDHIIIPTPTGTDVLDEKDNSYLPVAFPATTAGRPRIWAMESATQVKVAPVPDQNYTVTVVYYAIPESIVTAGTTWIGDNFETLLFYSCMIEAYIFMKGEADIMQMYLTAYQAEAEKLKAHTNASVWRPANA